MLDLILILLITIIVSIVITLKLVKYYNKQVICSGTGEKIKNLIRQTSRWAIASEQDSNVFIANLHANYAMGYLQAMKDNFTEREIEYSSGVKLNRFTSDIVNIQDKAAQKLISNCPSISAANPFLAELARE